MVIELKDFYFNLNTYYLYPKIQGSVPGYYSVASLLNQNEVIRTLGPQPNSNIIFIYNTSTGTARGVDFSFNVVSMVFTHTSVSINNPESRTIYFMDQTEYPAAYFFGDYLVLCTYTVLIGNRGATVQSIFLKNNVNTWTLIDAYSQENYVVQSIYYKYDFVGLYLNWFSEYYNSMQYRSPRLPFFGVFWRFHIVNTIGNTYALWCNNTSSQGVPIISQNYPYDDPVFTSYGNVEHGSWDNYTHSLTKLYGLNLDDNLLYRCVDDSHIYMGQLQPITNSDNYIPTQLRNAWQTAFSDVVDNYYMGSIQNIFGFEIIEQSNIVSGGILFTYGENKVVISTITGISAPVHQVISTNDFNSNCWFDSGYWFADSSVAGRHLHIFHTGANVEPS